MVILTNFKHYPSAIFSDAHALVQDHITVAKQFDSNLIRFSVAVGALDIQKIAEQFAQKIDIYAQHCDCASFGSSTGKILPEMLVQMGVKGVILNHSEHRLPSKETLFQTIEYAKKSGLQIVCCAETVEEGEWISNNTQADYIAVEPPELIGGDISVATARPELISESVVKIGEKKVMVGAGIKNGTDIRIAKEKGAIGVLLASGVTKSIDPKNVLYNLGKGAESPS